MLKNVSQSHNVIYFIDVIDTDLCKTPSPFQIHVPLIFY